MGAPMNEVVDLPVSLVGFKKINLLLTGYPELDARGFVRTLDAVTRSLKLWELPPHHVSFYTPEHNRFKNVLVDYLRPRGFGVKCLDPVGPQIEWDWVFEFITHFIVFDKIGQWDSGTLVRMAEQAGVEVSHFLVD